MQPASGAEQSGRGRNNKALRKRRNIARKCLKEKGALQNGRDTTKNVKNARKDKGEYMELMRRIRTDAKDIKDIYRSKLLSRYS